MSYLVTLNSQAEGDVLRERERQHYVEHFDAAHDDLHDRGELVSAALCYSMNAIVHAKMLAAGADPEFIAEKSKTAPVPATWPWAREWWKPKGARQNLVCAASLLIAEIERIDRAEARKARP